MLTIGNNSVCFLPVFKISFKPLVPFVKEKVSFEIYCSIEVKSWRFSDYSEFFLGGGGCYAALMRPNN